MTTGPLRKHNFVVPTGSITAAEPLLSPEIDRMGWEIDVRKGTATIGATRREGFALMRDREKRLIAFHANDRSDERAAFSPMREPDQFVVEEDAFFPA
jgi:hypothetical protein